ncbi:MAG: redoxin, partial [Planctomycetota bacterium]
MPSVDRAGFDALLAKHKGKVVLVDYWATWCGPCRKKFPHTVALAKQHEADEFVVIGVSLDDKDSQEVIEKFLADQHATFENVRAANGADDMEAFEIPNE